MVSQPSCLWWSLVVVVVSCLSDVEGGSRCGLENIPMRTTTDFKWTKGEKVDN